LTAVVHLNCLDQLGETANAVWSSCLVLVFAIWGRWTEHSSVEIKLGDDEGEIVVDEYW
jgi:hypothetical protein